MKYVMMIFFNLIAIYLLYVFMFGHGGALDNLSKMEKVHQLEMKRMTTEIELEDLKSLWYEKRQLKNPGAHFLANHGRKLEHTVIFKFRDGAQQEPSVNVARPVYHGYFLVAVGIFLMGLIFSDLILFYNFGKSS